MDDLILFLDCLFTSGAFLAVVDGFRAIGKALSGDDE